MTRHPGFFLSFEGIEGSGKSTQLRLLVTHLREHGYDVIENQEPGGTSIGKQIRRVLLDPANGAMSSMTELLLMFGSRAQAAAEIIQPALAAGQIVVSDRFTDSTLAYQGHARGLGFDVVMDAHRLALGSLFPDLTLAIDVDVQTGLERVLKRNAAGEQAPGEGRLDEQSLAFHQKVADGYRRIASLEPQRFRLVDGSGDRDQVAARIQSVVAEVLER